MQKTFGFYLKKYFVSKTNIRFIVLIVLIGVVVGTAGALLLTSLQWAEQIREAQPFFLFLLPIGGFITYLLYHRFGKAVKGGNILVIEEIKNLKKPIPFAMTPLIYIGTVLTHLFGGSAGREGSAVQMGASLTERLGLFLKLRGKYRRLVLLMGVSAGFTACFGTPIAATLFSLETAGLIGLLKNRDLTFEPKNFFKKLQNNLYKKISYLCLCLVASYWANYVCHLWGVAHTNYALQAVSEMNIEVFGISILAGLIFGLVARTSTLITNFFRYLVRFIKYPFLRIMAGGLLVALAVHFTGWTQYTGLGIDKIVLALHTQSMPYDFLIKMILTALTIGVGFKGGEVTPLFFIGATLGSALSIFLPLDISTLSAMGFVGVFAGATKTPLACMLMGVELFGGPIFPFVMVGCLVAYSISGKGIYNS